MHKLVDKIRELGYSPSYSTRCYIQYMHIMRVYLYTNINPYCDTIFQVCIIIDSRLKVKSQKRLTIENSGKPPRKFYFLSIKSNQSTFLSTHTH